MIRGAVTEAGLMKELCDHLRSIGIRATLLQPGSTEALGPAWKRGIFGSGYVLGCVKVEGKNLDMVQVERSISSTPGGGQLSSRRRGELVYRYHYVVKGRVDGLEHKLRAEYGRVEERKGQGKKVVDFRWIRPGKVSLSNILFALFFIVFPLPALLIGTQQQVPLPILVIFLIFLSIGLGLLFVSLSRLLARNRTRFLAQLLNGDSEVRTALLKAGPRGLVIRPDRKSECVRITPIIDAKTKAIVGPVSIDALGRRDFPSREAFEAYDKIAQQIRRIESQSVLVGSAGSSGKALGD